MSASLTQDLTLTPQPSRWLPPGRSMGGLMLLSFALGIISNFALQPLAWSQGGMLAGAASQGPAIGAAVLMDLTLALLGLCISVMLRQRYGAVQPALTTFCLAFSVAELALCLVEGSSLMAMQALSASYLAHPAQAEAYAPAAALLQGLRNGFHFSAKAFGGLGLLLFYMSIGKAKALPRPLVAAAMAAAAAQVWAVGQGFIGLDVPMLALAPLGLIYPLSALWLLWRGLPR